MWFFLIRKVREIMIILMLLVFICFVYALYEYRAIQKKHLTSKDFNVEENLGLKILYISDIQYDITSFLFQHRLMKKLIKMINKENPDLVLLGGDFIHKKRKEYPVFDYLKDIKAPKIAVLGNHDYKDKETVIEKCITSGIQLLVNETLTFKDLNIIGLDDLRVGKPKLPKFNQDAYNLLLIHEPDDFETYIKKHQFDIALAGHLHGGQVTLFGKYAPILPSRYGQRYRYGLVDREGHKIYVSSGLGGAVLFLPLRFFARPEIVILNI